MKTAGGVPFLGRGARFHHSGAENSIIEEFGVPESFFTSDKTGGVRP